MRYTLWRRTRYTRRSDFRVIEDSAERLVLRTRRFGLLAGGVVFIAAGCGVSLLAFTEAKGDLPAVVTILSFSFLLVLFGSTASWASFAQRDTITIDRARGIVESRRARTRKRPGQPLFRVEKAPLSALEYVEFRVNGGSASLRLMIRHASPIEVDFGTDIEQLESLGRKLASAAGVELR